VGAQLIRIVSDVHYGDHSCRVRSLSQLRPLLEGASAFVFNGDTLDTRPSGDEGRTERLRREVLEFSASAGIPVTLLTGNHDPDLTANSSLELAGGEVLVTHGDILFDAIVPWSKDAPVIRKRIAAALANVPQDGPGALEGRLAAFRSVAASVHQLHQSEKNPLRYVAKLATDTVWPPHRVVSILKAWKQAPGKAAALAQRHRPKARFIITGHTHRPGVWTMPSGVVVINTGSFSRPFGTMAAEVSETKVRVRRIERRAGGFHPGRYIAEFPLS